MKYQLGALLALASLAAAFPTAAADENCNNYGTVTMVGIGNKYDCQSYTVICDQGSGSGAGAGAGGPGHNEAGAEATAGNECSQDINNGTGNETRREGTLAPAIGCLKPLVGAGVEGAAYVTVTSDACDPASTDASHGIVYALTPVSPPAVYVPPWLPGV